MDGDRHKATRKQMALHIASTKKEQEEVVIKTADKLLSAFFTNNCKLDLLTDIALPLWHAISAIIIRNENNVQEIVDLIPSLFYPVLSIRKREQINNRLADIIAHQGEECLLGIALATLGARPFSGSLTLSLYDAAVQNKTGIVSALELGEGYKKSSLTYVDRICKSDSSVGPHHITAGERVRCVTQSSKYTEEQNISALYGFGAHVCLGRPISQFTFNLLKERLKRFDCKMIPEQIEMQDDCNPFTLPLRAIVSIEI